MKNYYKILDVTEKSSITEIKNAFRKKAMIYHPDRNKDIDTNDMFIEITEAYEVLSNKESRDIYDKLVKSNIEYSNNIYETFSNWKTQGRKKAEEYAKCTFCGKDADYDSFQVVYMHKVKDTFYENNTKKYIYDMISVNIPYCKKCSEIINNQRKIVSIVNYTALTILYFIIYYLLYNYSFSSMLLEKEYFTFFFMSALVTILYIGACIRYSILLIHIAFAFSVGSYYKVNWYMFLLLGLFSFISYNILVHLIKYMVLSRWKRINITFPQYSEKVKNLKKDGWKVGSSPV